MRFSEYRCRGGRRPARALSEPVDLMGEAREHWPRIAFTNPPDRLGGEIERSLDVVRPYREQRAV